LTGKYFDKEDKNMEVLEYCRYPRDAIELIDQFGEQTIQELTENFLLSDVENVWEQTNIEHMEIEICAHCNWKCEFCPVSFDPKLYKVMEMDVYNEIIDKAARHQPLKHISFNFYNEPTLDPHFADRVRKLAQTRLKLILFTNGSMLDKEKIQLIKDLNVLYKVRINVPSVEEEEFVRLTGSRLFDVTMQNIQGAIDAGFDVEILVNGTTEEIKNNLKKIQDKYSPFKNVTVINYMTMDRAGLLKNRYAMNYYHEGDICGCTQILRQVLVKYDGSFFICTMDYYQKYVYGNIRDGEIADIMKSPKSQQIRKRVFGAESVSKDYICRKCWVIMVAGLEGRHSRRIKPVFH